MATAYPTSRPVGMHPVHGIISGFPLALFSAALVSDIAYARSAQIQWANFSAWLIAGGIFMTVLAAIAGIVDAILYRGWPRRRPWTHSVATLAMVVLALFNAFVHSRDGWTSVVPTGLILSVLVVVLAFFTSWLGYAIQARQESK